MNGVLIRSKLRWFKHGEKPSRYFLNMEKRNYVNKTINQIVENDNTCLTNSKEFFYETTGGFIKTFTRSMRPRIISILIPFLLIQSFQLFQTLNVTALKALLLIKSFLDGALKNSKNEKSPGSDGFSFKFFEFFISDLLWYLLR